MIVQSYACISMKLIGHHADDDRQWRCHGGSGGWARAPDAPGGAAVPHTRPNAARASVACLLPCCGQAHTGCGRPEGVTALLCGVALLYLMPHCAFLACLHMQFVENCLLPPDAVAALAMPQGGRSLSDGRGMWCAASYCSRLTCTAAPASVRHRAASLLALSWQPP